MSPLAWGRLLRLSLAPSAAADIAAGLCLGAWGMLPARRESLLLVLASLCVYHGGMALNDWADRRGDARTRPDRPIPSGAVAARSALGVAVAMLVAGPVLAWIAAPRVGFAMGLVALCAATYDVAGRGPWRGPLLLALCRGGNLACGVLLGASFALQGRAPGAPNLAWAACLLYAGYVLFASRLGRLEDDEDERALGSRPGAALAWASLCLLVLPFLAGFSLGPRTLYSVQGRPQIALSVFPMVLVLGAPVILAFGLALWGLLRESFREEWTRALVGRATGMALRRLMVFTSMCALISFAPSHHAWLEGRVVPGVEGWPGFAVGWLILLGYPLSYGLRRVFPPT